MKCSSCGKELKVPYIHEDEDKLCLRCYDETKRYVLSGVLFSRTDLEKRAYMKQLKKLTKLKPKQRQPHCCSIL